MSTLRVLLTAAPSPARASAWALFDTDGGLLESGRGEPSTWPVTNDREAVLAASAVRLLNLALPPMPADRVAAAATFALEDQFAAPADQQHLVPGTQQRAGNVPVTIAPRALVAALQKDFARVVAEPAVAPIPADGHWRWYASGGEGSFVRKADGSAFAVSAPADDVPAELALALAHAARTQHDAPVIDVAFAAADAQLAAWSAQCATTFVRVAAWSWERGGAALAAATNLLQGEFAREPRVVPHSLARRFRWPVAIAATALFVHVAATFVQWAWLRADAWRMSRAVVAVAREAGVGDAPDVSAAVAGLARKFTDARHRAALTAPADALPLLARAAPALAALPTGALKNATYTTGQWTFELAKLEPGARNDFDRRLAVAGLAPIAATSDSGTRARVTLAPGMERP